MSANSLPPPDVKTQELYPHWWAWYQHWAAPACSCGCSIGAPRCDEGVELHKIARVETALYDRWVEL